MSEEEIYNIIKEMIIEQFGIEESSIKKDANFIDDLAADSLDLVELVMNIEERFDIEIPDDEAEKLINIEDMVKYIASKK